MKDAAFALFNKEIIYRLAKEILYGRLLFGGNNMELF